MKRNSRILLSVLAITLAACAHETTTMDRELALKLADNRANVQVVQAAPPVFNVNFNGGSSGESASNSSSCRMVPTYDAVSNGTVYRRQCFGSDQ